MAQNIDLSIQSNDEWLSDYENASGEPVRVAPIEPQATVEVSPQILFHYVDHRTTTMGSVVLEFESSNNHHAAVSFYNVSLRSSRGKNYPAGKRGQFNPPPNGKFRRFWMSAVGHAPARWSRVHKSMRSTLGSLLFVGETVRAIDRNGHHYTKLTEVRPL